MHLIKSESHSNNRCGYYQNVILPPEQPAQMERIRQYDSSDTGHSDNVNIAAEHQEPAEVLSQLDNTSNSPVYGEYKCC